MGSTPLSWIHIPLEKKIIQYHYINIVVPILECHIIKTNFFKKQELTNVLFSSSYYMVTFGGGIKSLRLSNFFIKEHFNH